MTGFARFFIVSILAGLSVRRLAAQEEPSPSGTPDSRLARESLTLIREALAVNDREGAREILREILDSLQPPAPGDEPPRIAFLLELDRLAKELGSLRESLAARESILELRKNTLPPDHLEVVAAQQAVAVKKWELGDIEGAHPLFEQVLAVRTRLLPPDHHDLIAAKQNLALVLHDSGDLQGALALEQEVVAAWTRLLPADDRDLLIAKQNLATTMHSLGDFAGAQVLEEEVLAIRTRVLAPDHPDLLLTKLDLAVTLSERGDLAGARALEEEVVATWTRLLPPDHPDLLAAKLNLSSTRDVLGDLVGARSLEEEVIAAWTRLLPSDHPALLGAMVNLASTKFALGDSVGAKALFEEVLAVRARTLPAGHPDVLEAEQNLAVTRRELGDPSGARTLFEDVLSARTRSLPPDHPHLLAAKQNLAVTKKAQGDLEGALALEEEVLEARTRLLPPDHPDSLAAVQNLASLRAKLGDFEGARRLVSSLLEGMRVRANALRSESLRSAREGVREKIDQLSVALYLSEVAQSDGTLAPELFATLENLRVASVVSADVAHALEEHSELRNKALEIAGLRSSINDLVAAGPESDGSVEDWRKELLRLATERDRAEHGLHAGLREAGVFVAEVDAKALGAVLVRGTAAISFLRYPRIHEDEASPVTPPTVDSLLGFLVLPGGTVRQVELGPAAGIEAVVRQWREALGRPLEGRGVTVVEAASERDSLEKLGQRLRELVLDPVLASAGDVHTLHIVLDDFLHLVPLDALPLGECLVGDRLALRNEVTLARLLRPNRGSDLEGTLTVMGGVDYDSEFGSESHVRLEASTPPVEPVGSRSPARVAGFASLPGTSTEAAAIAALYREVFERESVVLSKGSATKDTLFASAPRTRFLHLATHGWFAPESFCSQLDPSANQAARETWQRAEETLLGFAPETLSGLALAGANRGRDAVGRVPGILTAEELATFDLRNCELAVLSACETNVGIRRAGQGIQSLQTALHAAGARTAITSLWKVDDAATCRLIELFYTKLWKDHLGKADALWQAKMALRAEGHPPRDWAAWVLSGDPE